MKESFKTVPKEHQIQTICFAVSKKRCAFWLGIGLGKTLAALYAAVLCGAKRVLVVCPPTIVRTWMEEIVKHTELTYTLIAGVSESGKPMSRAERKRRFDESDADVMIINYEGLKVLFGEKATTRDAFGVEKTKYVPQYDWSRLQFDCLIIDEAHALRDPSSLHTRICYELSMRMQYVFLLTGTPLSKQLQELWAQYWVLDGGATLGTNRHAFLSAFFEPVKREFYKGSFTEWIPRMDAKDKILARVSGSTIRFDRRDCLDLPPLTTQEREVEMSGEQVKLTHAASAGLAEIIDGEVVNFNNLRNKSTKLAQIAGGFYLDGPKAVRLKTNPKLDELWEVLQQVDGKAIIFHTFVEEGRLIESMLYKKEMRYASLRGEVNDKQAQLSRFINDPQVSVLVANPVSGGAGLNLQVANTIIYYSYFGMSSIMLDQTMGRIYRTGQTQQCTVIYLVMRDSIDEPVLRALERNTDVLQGVLDWMRTRK